MTEEQANDTRYTNARVHAINIGHAQTLNDVTVCHNCQKSIKKAKKKCTGCLSRFYCSHKCLKKDAKTHSLVCPQHDAIGLSVRFVASPLGLFSPTDHPLYARATKVVALEDGMPCAIWAVPTGQSFCQILKRVCGDFVIVDSSLYAQLIILAKEWTPDRDRFSIFTGGAPVSAQLEVFNMPYGSAITLVPENHDVMRVFGFCQGKTTLDHFQGPRQVELIKDGDFYRGLTRTMGPVRMELHEWGDVASDELYDWCQILLDLPTPITLGTESTWSLNKACAQTIMKTQDEIFCWKTIVAHNDEPWAESDEDPWTESDEGLDLDAAEQLGYLTLNDILTDDDE